MCTVLLRLADNEIRIQRGLKCISDAGEKGENARRTLAADSKLDIIPSVSTTVRLVIQVALSGQSSSDVVTPWYGVPQKRQCACVTEGQEAAVAVHVDEIGALSEIYTVSFIHNLPESGSTFPAIVRCVAQWWYVGVIAGRCPSNCVRRGDPCQRGRPDNGGYCSTAR